MQTQLDFSGHPRPTTGNRVRNELAEIMEGHPETQNDEDLLAAYWVLKHGQGPLYLCEDRVRCLQFTIRTYRKANIRARRQELRHLYPYSPEEEARRQARGRGGPPG